MADPFYEAVVAGKAAEVGSTGVTSAVVVPNSEFRVYEVDDTARANPVQIRTEAGILRSSLLSSPIGALPAASVISPNYEHLWVSGSGPSAFVWRRVSQTRMRELIEAAAAAAEESLQTIRDLLANNGGGGGGGQTMYESPAASGYYVIEGQEAGGDRFVTVGNDRKLPSDIVGSINLDTDAGLERKAANVAGTKSGQGFRPGTFVGTSLPSASNFGMGTIIYNTTTKTLLVSDGSVWVAAGGGSSAPSGTKPMYTFDFTTANTARPINDPNVVIRWRGPVQPTNMLDGDEWYVKA